MDEWQTSFSRWPDISARPPDELVSESWRAHNSELSLLAYLLLLSRPEHDEQRVNLQDFVGDNTGSTILNMGALAQQPQAYIDHQLWLDNEARSMTIPRQPNKILTNSDLDYQLRPIVSP